MNNICPICSGPLKTRVRTLLCGSFNNFVKSIDTNLHLYKKSAYGITLIYLNRISWCEISYFKIFIEKNKTIVTMFPETYFHKKIQFDFQLQIDDFSFEKVYQKISFYMKLI